MISVMFVCLGNICRSPMAHGILRHKAAQQGLKMRIESSGTSGFHEGEPADSRAIANLASHGIDIRDLRSMPFEDAFFDQYEYIMTMDDSNQQNVIQAAQRAGTTNLPTKLMSYSQLQPNISVPDPYYGGDNGFEDVYKMIDEAINEFLKTIKK